tara:strand:- start:3292 stop:4089 length:798 start_codon:yes stop_codon:yes gene_type:complete
MSGESMEDHWSEGPVDIECGTCEYEFEGHATCTGYGCEITLTDFDDSHFTGDPPMYSPPSQDDSFYWNYSTPDHPLVPFLATYTNMLELLEKAVDTNGDSQLINRMIFVQIISAMEAYLADTLINNVVGKRPQMLALTQKNPDFITQKFTVSQILEEANLAENSVKKYLKSVIYHNLAKVEKLYISTLEIGLSDDRDVWEKLNKAIHYRHDCVHRNGYNENNEKIEIFSDDYIRETADAAKALVRHIEEKLDEMILFRNLLTAPE